jgi:sulfur-oxidizing protein SoxX
MRKRGSRLSRPKILAEIRRAALVALLLAAASATDLSVAQDQAALRPYEVEGDGIPRSLTGTRGDPARGRALVADRQRGLCLLCHSGPFPEQPFQGDLAPSLAGAGSRLSESQLRLRIVDGSRINPATIMPSYYRTEGLTRVGRAWQGKPVLSAEQIEDMVAFLATLTDDGPARNPPRNPP